MKTFNQMQVESDGAIMSDITDAYAAEFGVPPSGQKVFLRLTPVNQYGVAGAPTIVSATVPTASLNVTVTLTAGAVHVVTATWVGGAILDLQWEEYNTPAKNWTVMQVSPGSVTTATYTASATGVLVRAVSQAAGVGNKESNSVTAT